MSLGKPISLKWQRYFLGLAEYVSTASKDPSTKVGAVIVNPETLQVISSGFNGFPQGVADTDERYNDRETKLELVAHAEANAIARSPIPVRGLHIFITPTLMVPASCPGCSKLIVQSGIKKVWFWHEDNLSDRWEKMAKFTKIILSEGGVEWEYVPHE